ncbi:RNA-binding protein spenito [Chironomus tepperi]|uniref:RNA-binding protein spenito n=1 Tax=Chironomus tepperi TaxID=113505 RepID=UPI00391F73EF
MSSTERITVRVPNKMKRSTSRESPPIRKRRASLGRYDGSSDERMSPDRMRRRHGSPLPRYASPPREKYAPIAHTYKVLCVSALHPKATDEYIRETLYREFKKFGDFSVRLSLDENRERIAYVCFRTADDARAAKAAKPRVMVYEKIAIVEPVYESVRRQRSASPPAPEFDRYYSRGSPERRRPAHHPEPYERYPSNSMHHPEYRPVMHSEYINSPRPPPMHHHHGMHPAPHYAPRPYIPRPRIPYEKPENKKDKFPNYLHHVQPEDDPLATRTLFAGNLEINISDDELKRIFGKYGIVEDIDIKRPPPGTGNAFAFVRYQNLDMAHRAKVELSGQYIGKFQCKIGYGKATASTKIWVGGLGAWTSSVQLEGEFDRFGAIKKIEYTKGDANAYIQYETIDAAQAAVKEMRGFPLGGPDKRLRVDFADNGEPIPPQTFKPKDFGTEYRKDYEYEGNSAPYEEPHYSHNHHHPYNSGYSRPYRGRGIYRGRGTFRGSYHSHHSAERFPPPHDDEWRGRPPNDMDYDPYRLRRSPARLPGGIERSRSRSPKRRSLDSDSDSGMKRNGNLGSLRTLSEVARKSSTKWEGALILKSSLFPAKFHLTDGDVDIVESLMRDENGTKNLRITQRLRLDQPKLEDVQKRINSSSSMAIFVGLSGPTINSDDANIQTRPLRNLVSYLKQKEAAGVISLLNKETEATGVLYVFPPCEFSTELLKRTCSGLSEEGLKEDHLVIVVVRGGTA